jgi:hypothetical protein
MRVAKEVRRWVNRLRKRHAGANGVVPGYAFDNPAMERKQATSNQRREPLSFNKGQTDE